MDSGPFLFRNYENPFSPFDGVAGKPFLTAARATSAVPLFFAPMMDGKSSFCDGGLGFNNPTELAYIEATKLGDCDINYILSIGCGQPPEVKSSLGQHQMVALVGAASAQLTSTNDVHVRIQALSERENFSYFRFNVPLTDDVPFDTHDRTQLQLLVKATQTYLRQPKIEAMFAKLKQKATSR
jgi:predicted acylesterase/phospholipase RssA